MNLLIALTLLTFAVAVMFIPGAMTIGAILTAIASVVVLIALASAWAMRVVRRENLAKAGAHKAVKTEDKAAKTYKKSVAKAINKLNKFNGYDLRTK